MMAGPILKAVHNSTDASPVERHVLRCDHVVHVVLMG